MITNTEQAVRPEAGGAAGLSTPWRAIASRGPRDLEIPDLDAPVVVEFVLVTRLVAGGDGPAVAPAGNAAAE